MRRQQQIGKMLSSKADHYRPHHHPLVAAMGRAVGHARSHQLVQSVVQVSGLQGGCVRLLCPRLQNLDVCLCATHRTWNSNPGWLMYAVHVSAHEMKAPQCLCVCSKREQAAAGMQCGSSQQASLTSCGNGWWWYNVPAAGKTVAGIQAAGATVNWQQLLTSIMVVPCQDHHTPAHVG